MDVIYLEFSEAFDVVTANIPAAKLEKYEFDGLCCVWLGWS